MSKSVKPTNQKTIEPSRAKDPIFIVAVSGGVDSIVLLHMLASNHNLDFKAERNKSSFIIAHFDHGIRQDSSLDRIFVQKLAMQYGMKFEFQQGNLGVNASEENARRSRYQFLDSVCNRCGAGQLITAHHQDDLVETAIINISRGSGPRGLFSLRTTKNILRPLLNLQKKDLYEYAAQHGLEWREDSTNSDTKYLRNLIRQKLALNPNMNSENLVRLINDTEKIYQLINVILKEFNDLSRQQFVQLPHLVAREVMAEELRKRSVANISKTMIERLVIFAKTGQIGAKIDVDKNWWLIQNIRKFQFRQKNEVKL